MCLFIYFLPFYYLCTHIHLCCLLSQASLWFSLLLMCLLWFILIYSLFLPNLILFFILILPNINCIVLVILKLDAFSFLSLCRLSVLHYAVLHCLELQEGGPYFASPVIYCNQIYFKLSHVFGFNIHSTGWQLMSITLFPMSFQINLPLPCIKETSATSVFWATRGRLQ